MIKIKEVSGTTRNVVLYLFRSVCPEYERNASCSVFIVARFLVLFSDTSDFHIVAVRKSVRLSVGADLQVEDGKTRIERKKWINTSIFLE